MLMAREREPNGLYIYMLEIGSIPGRPSIGRMRYLGDH